MKIENELMTTNITNDTYYYNDYEQIICDPYEVTYVTTKKTTTKDDSNSLLGISQQQKQKQKQPKVKMEWKCQMDQMKEDGIWGISYKFINLSSNYFEHNNITSGQYTLEFFAKIINKSQYNHGGGTLDVNLNAPIKVINKFTTTTATTTTATTTTTTSRTGGVGSTRRRRKMQVTTTTTPQLRSALMIRASGLDSEPSLDATTLSNSAFGFNNNNDNNNDNGDINTLVTQFDACSGGKLQFIPAIGENITNGIIDIILPYNLTGMIREEAQNLVIAETSKYVDQLNQYNHIMIVLPNEVDFNYADAYGKLFGWLTVYRDYIGQYLTVHMHEIGHNLGLKHSGEGAVTYDDQTCLMGDPPYDSIMCFNGAKSWFLQWYNDRHVTIKPNITATNTIISPIEPPTLIWKGKLVGINDYINDETIVNEHYVIIKIENMIGRARDIYLMYNRKEGINRGVPEYPDHVTIVYANNIDTRVSGQSDLLYAMKGPYQQYRINNVDNNNQGLNLIIQACGVVFDTPDYTNVQIYIENTTTATTATTTTASENNNNNDNSNTMLLPCHCNDTNECNDNDLCTQDECIDGICINSKINCNDNIFLINNKPCHIGNCNPNNGQCEYTLDENCIWPSTQPSQSLQPSYVPSNKPSLQPSITFQPSTIPSNKPSISFQPSQSQLPSTIPSYQPSISLQPTISSQPSYIPSEQPSISSLPSLQPTINERRSNTFISLFSIFGTMALITTVVFGTKAILKRHKRNSVIIDKL